MPPIRVFLDSSDYSVLSGNEATREPFASILLRLREFARSGAVAFYFTGPQLAEMASLDPAADYFALERADLLVELCGRRCAISPERLICWELASALQLPLPADNIWSERGDWFPGGALELIKVSTQERDDIILESLAEQGLNRAQRRLARRKLKKPAAQRHVNAMLAANVEGDNLIHQMRQNYPMTEVDARVLARYVAGTASSEEASAAIGSSFGDPSLLFRWVQQQPVTADLFMDWVRGPASELTASILEMAELVVEMRNLESRFCIQTNIDHLTGAAWTLRTNHLLLSMAQRFAAEYLKHPAKGLTVKILEERCPGLVCAVRTFSHAWRAALVQSSRRPPKDSDFADMLHAMYAPYFHVFRADGFMAPVIAKNITPSQAVVVGKLVQLPSAIETALNAA
jgi:hypothetical protein